MLKSIYFFYVDQKFHLFKVQSLTISAHLRSDKLCYVIDIWFRVELSLIGVWLSLGFDVVFGVALIEVAWLELAFIELPLLPFIWLELAGVSLDYCQ